MNGQAGRGFKGKGDGVAVFDSWSGLAECRLRRELWRWEGGGVCLWVHGYSALVCVLLFCQRLVVVLDEVLCRGLGWQFCLPRRCTCRVRGMRRTLRWK